MKCFLAPVCVVLCSLSLTARAQNDWPSEQQAIDTCNARCEIQYDKDKTAADVRFDEKKLAKKKELLEEWQKNPNMFASMDKFNEALDKALAPDKQTQTTALNTAEIDKVNCKFYCRSCYAQCHNDAANAVKRINDERSKAFQELLNKKPGEFAPIKEQQGWDAFYKAEAAKLEKKFKSARDAVTLTLNFCRGFCRIKESVTSTSKDGMVSFSPDTISIDDAAVASAMFVEVGPDWRDRLLELRTDSNSAGAVEVTAPTLGIVTADTDARTVYEAPLVNNH